MQKTCMECVYVPTKLPFYIPPLVVGYSSFKPHEVLAPVFFLFLFLPACSTERGGREEGTNLDNTEWTFCQLLSVDDSSAEALEALHFI